MLHDIPEVRADFVGHCIPVHQECLCQTDEEIVLDQIVLLRDREIVAVLVLAL